MTYELMKHLFYTKGECKREGKTFIEIDDDAKSRIESHLSLEIRLLFPVAYNDYCAEIEANFIN